MSTDAERIAELEAENATLRRGEPAQLSREDLKGMSPTAIREADKAGRLDDLRRNGDPSTQTGYRQHSPVGKPVQMRDYTPPQR